MAPYVGCISIAVLSAASFGSPHRASAQSAAPPAEVILVGTIHLAHLLDPDYTLAHLRALLAKIRPDILATENLPERQSAGRNPALLPEFHVVATYAAEHAIPIKGIDWGAPVDTTACFWTDERKASQHRSDWIRDLAQSDALIAFGEPPGGIEASQHKIRWEDLNVDDREYVQDSANIPREDHIATNIHRVAVANPGKRIVVLLGSTHLFTQTIRLSALSDLRLVASASFLPLTAAELNAAARPDDIPILLAANLESVIAIAAPQTRNQQRTRELVTRLRQDDPSGHAGVYYEAWWHWTMGRHEEAAALFDRVIAGTTNDSVAWVGTARSSWPPWKRFHDKALFGRAALYDLQGQHAHAVGLYQRLLDSLPPSALRARRASPYEYYDLAGYLRLLIREGFRGGRTEAERSIDFHSCGAPGG